MSGGTIDTTELQDTCGRGGSKPSPSKMMSTTARLCDTSNGTLCEPTWSNWPKTGTGPASSCVETNPCPSSWCPARWLSRETGGKSSSETLILSQRHGGTENMLGRGVSVVNVRKSRHGVNPLAVSLDSVPLCLRESILPSRLWFSHRGTETQRTCSGCLFSG